MLKPFLCEMVFGDEEGGVLGIEGGVMFLVRGLVGVSEGGKTN